MFQKAIEAFKSYCISGSKVADIAKPLSTISANLRLSVKVNEKKIKAIQDNVKEREKEFAKWREEQSKEVTALNSEIDEAKDWLNIIKK